MPFSYLQDAPDSPTAPSANVDFNNARDVSINTARDVLSGNVHFQMPQLLLGPTLAPGGGAEVLPTGLLPTPDAFSASWAATSAITSLASASFPPHFSPSPYPFGSAYPGPRKLSSNFDSSTSPPSHQQPFVAPSPLGLPVYSTSGFDLLNVLGRVASRPNPRIVLGPVDMSCAFVVTDTRRYDNPVVYASPTFCRLTGYSESEVLGRNCRFLQHPEGAMDKGDNRVDTNPGAVSTLRHAVMHNKECQTSMINYRKGGAAFVNLITVIPVPGGVNNTPEEADDYVYHVGFQVDLTEQPNAILNKLRDGTYIVNYSRTENASIGLPHTRDWRTNSALMSGASKELRAMLTDPAFTTSIPLSLGTTSLSSVNTANAPSERALSDPYDGNKLLHLLFLQMLPGDFIHVVSLKGVFLHVAPNVKRVLGYDPEEFVGKNIGDFCHPADVVPLMRELKESSTAANAAATAATLSATSIVHPASPEPGPNNPQLAAKVVDLLFRITAKTPQGGHEYVWLESRGRLHIEPGKGRKAIILSGRVRRMPTLNWGLISRNVPCPRPSTDQEPAATAADIADFWGLLSSHGTFLFVGSAIRYVLGWGAGEVIGRPLVDLVPHAHASPNPGSEAEQQKQVLEQTLLSVQNDSRFETQAVECEMGKKDGGVVSVKVLLFRPATEAHGPATIVCHVRVVCPGTFQHAPPEPQGLSQGYGTHASGEDVFAEIDPGKDTSWQYELQQLKYTKQRLVEEVRELEGELGIEPRYGDSPPSTARSTTFDGPSDRSHATEGEPALMHRYEGDFNALSGWQGRRTPHIPISVSMPVSTTHMAPPHMQQMPYPGPMQPVSQKTAVRVRSMTHFGHGQGVPARPPSQAQNYTQYGEQHASPPPPQQPSGDRRRGQTHSWVPLKRTWDARGEGEQH